MPTVIAPDGRYLVALGREVEKGEHVEVDEETAASLVDQGWVSARSAAAKKAARRRAREAHEDDDQDDDADEGDGPVEEPSIETPAGEPVPGKE
jgi:hypothetical protein